MSDETAWDRVAREHAMFEEGIGGPCRCATCLAARHIASLARAALSTRTAPAPMSTCPECGGRQVGLDVTGEPSFGHRKECPTLPKPQSVPAPTLDPATQVPAASPSSRILRGGGPTPKGTKATPETPPAMKPEQRCTRTVVHLGPDSNGGDHEFDEHMDAWWKREPEQEAKDRCHYIAPTPPGPAPVAPPTTAQPPGTTGLPPQEIQPGLTGSRRAAVGWREP